MDYFHPQNNLNKMALLEEKNELYQREISFLKESLSLAEERYQSLKNVVDDLREEFFRKNQEAILLDSRCRAKDEQIFEHKQTISFLKTSYADKQSRCLDLQAEVQKLKESYALRDQEVVLLNAQVRALDEHNLDRQRYIDFLKESLCCKEMQLNLLRARVEEAQCDVNSRDQKLLELVVKMKCLNEEHGDHRRQITFLEEILDSKDRQYGMLQTDLEELKASLEEKVQMVSVKALERLAKKENHAFTEQPSITKPEPIPPKSPENRLKFSTINLEKLAQDFKRDGTFQLEDDCGPLNADGASPSKPPFSPPSEISTDSTDDKPIKGEEKMSTGRNSPEEEEEEEEEVQELPSSLPDKEASTIYPPSVDEKGRRQNFMKCLNDFLQYKSSESKQCLRSQRSKSQFQFTLEGNAARLSSCSLFNDLDLYQSKILEGSSDDLVAGEIPVGSRQHTNAIHLDSFGKDHIFSKDIDSDILGDTDQFMDLSQLDVKADSNFDPSEAPAIGCEKKAPSILDKENVDIEHDEDSPNFKTQSCRF